MDVEHFFMCLLAIGTSFFEKALFSAFAHFFTGSLIFGGQFLSSQDILIINLLSDV
jgi:hypothetical protein